MRYAAADDSLRNYLDAALVSRWTSRRFLKYGAIGAGAGLAALGIAEVFWVDALQPPGLVLILAGLGTGLVGGRVFDSRAKTELGRAIAMVSPSQALQHEAIGRVLKPREYAWLAAHGFDIYAYRWNDTEVNRLLRKSIRGRRTSNSFWEYGGYTAMATAAVMAIAVSTGNYHIGFLLALPVYAVQLVAAAGGWLSKEVALDRLRRASALRPLQLNYP